MCFCSWNEPRLQTETCSVVFGIFRECGNVFYRVRYGAVHTFSHSRFVAVYLWKSITCIYCMWNLSHMGQNSQCWKKKGRIHVNTPLPNEWMEQSVSGMTQDGFVKVIWQTETGSEINLFCWCHSDLECLDDVSSSSHDFSGVVCPLWITFQAANRGMKIAINELFKFWRPSLISNSNWAR